MPVVFRSAAATHLGTVRDNNEDSALTSGRVLALADGMGGHAAGEVASSVVTWSIAAVAEAPDDVPEQFAVATARAQTALQAMSDAVFEMEGMGTTLVALGIDADDSVVMAHIGDSRVYRWRAGVLSQVTVDHTHVQRLVDTGQIAPEEAHSHPYRSVILRSLDDQSMDQPDVSLPDLAVGDRVLLCSDGLSDYVHDDVIAAQVGAGSVDDAAQALVRVALTSRTRDNVTVVVSDIVDDVDVSDAAAPLVFGAAGAPLPLSEEAREALWLVMPELAETLAPEPDSETVEDAGVDDVGLGPDSVSEVADDADQPSPPQDSRDAGMASEPRSPEPAHRTLPRIAAVALAVMLIVGGVAVIWAASRG